MCEHRGMADLGVSLIIADSTTSYWLAGILTAVAALIVSVVTLVSVGAEEDETP